MTDLRKYLVTESDIFKHAVDVADGIRTHTTVEISPEVLTNSWLSVPLNIPDER
jgi:hypothetical protein